MWTEFLNRRINVYSYFLSEAEFLDEIQTKVLRVFLHAIHSNPYSFALRFLFLKLMQPLTVSTVQLPYILKEKGGNLIENQTPFHTETSCLRTLKIMPRNLNEIARSWNRLQASLTILIKNTTKPLVSLYWKVNE